MKMQEFSPPGGEIGDRARKISPYIGRAELSGDGISYPDGYEPKSHHVFAGEDLRRKPIIATGPYSTHPSAKDSISLFRADVGEIQH